jgi:hypothetical protein
VVSRKMLTTIDSLKETGRQIDRFMADKAGDIPGIVVKLRVNCEELIVENDVIAVYYLLSYSAHRYCDEPRYAL